MHACSAEHEQENQELLTAFEPQVRKPATSIRALEGWTYARIAIEQESLACAAGLY